ncbi:MAG: RNA 2'-phosphotransferase [Deltaproteobacteria bacterium]|nr:RNA 2'-phosphotransferase [Deltaproteobacteria bacterium]
MTSRRSRIRIENFTRFLVYVLGHSPDEFGLLPDPEGFVGFKELLWAVHEEPGWGYVRISHIQEVLLGKDRDLFEVDDNRIRTLERRWRMDFEHPAETLPKLLYIAVRRRAHSHALEKGLRAAQGAYLLLSPEKDMALRIGRRRDQEPVLLEILSDMATTEGLPFYAFGRLFLAAEIPSRYIKGPPLPKKPLKSPVPDPAKLQERMPDFLAGTFVLEEGRDPATGRRTKGKKRKGWKEEARKLRRKRP